MSEMLKIVLSLSLSGSLLMLILFPCKRLLKNRISRRWQYYIWLVVIARLLLPFAPETSLVGTLFQDADRSIVQMDIIPAREQGNIAGTPLPESDSVGGDFVPQDGELLKAATLNSQAVWDYIRQNLWLIWLVVALMLLIRKMTIYQGFVRYVKAGCAEVSDTAILDRLALIGEQTRVKTPVELYTNSLTASPLLLGFFRPCIILPTADLPDPDFEYTILHELTHYKRRDMFYKWLVQLTVCLHWFNPLVYLMGREISRACELACDEAIIQKLDTKRQRDYGDTLLNAVVTGGDYRDSLASMPLNESKELLKERLAAIMKFKNPSQVVRISTAFLTVAIIFGATFTGAYAAIPNQTASTENKKAAQVPAVSFDPQTDVINISSNGQQNIIKSGSFEAKENQSLTLTIQSDITGGAVDFFLFSPSGKERRMTIDGSDKTETVILTAGRWEYNCTGFFDSGAVTIEGQLSALEENAAISGRTVPPANTKAAQPNTMQNQIVVNISSNGQQNIVKSGSFEAKENQSLTLTIQSDITGGAVDFFLFSPSGKERRITVDGSDKTETVVLTAGRWAYNCTGFFESGAVTIEGRLFDGSSRSTHAGGPPL